MAFAIVSDKPLGEREQFIQEMMNAFAEADVRKIAVVGKLPGGEILTAYWNMELEDKMLTSSWMQMDVVHEVIRVNMPHEEEDEDGDADF